MGASAIACDRCIAMCALFPREVENRGRDGRSARYPCTMSGGMFSGSSRVGMFRATVWLGTKLSVFATVLAVTLPLIGDVSRWSLVVAVASLAFVSSWIQTGRLQRGEAPMRLVHLRR